MSSKKTKILENAQRNILKGQFDRAINDYRQIIELEPSELRHRQKIAELLTKAKQNDEAIKEYTFIAKHYVDSDHYLKAIAVYKQIQKLNPQNPEIALTLASLNEKQGMIGNAVAEYSAVVQIYEKNGENLKALKALESIMALDGDNSAVKLRIAEKYFAVGSEDKSFETFSTLLKELKERNDENGFSLIAERAINLFGKLMKEALGQCPAALSAEGPIKEVLPAAPETMTSSENVSEVLSAPAGSSPYATPPHVSSPEIIDAAACDEIDYIDDIIPLDEDEVVESIIFSDNADEWEEEIEFPSLEAAAEPFANDSRPSEETAAVDELEDIELELELDDELPSVTAKLSESSPAQPVVDFDLGKDLSLFADEIDFGPFSKQEQDAVFDASDAGLTKGELDNEDAESHYSLGLAYKEMGLWDEAIAEFVVAARSSERKIDSLILEGVCHRELGNIAKAIEILADTLKFDHLTEDERLGVQYELALCHEASGDFAEARKLLTLIVNIRPAFSDVAVRLEELPS